MMTYQQKKEKEFVTEGGIRERMTAALLGYRTNQRETFEQLTREMNARNRSPLYQKTYVHDRFRAFFACHIGQISYLCGVKSQYKCMSV